MQEDNIKRILSKIGLDSIEIEIYFLCLKYGSLWATTISRLMHIPRTTIHDRLEKLANKGVVNIEKANKGNKFAAARSQAIIDNIYAENEKNIQIVQEIKEHEKERWELTNTNNSLPKISFYEWSEVFKILKSKIKKHGKGDFIENIDSILESTWRTLKKLSEEFFLWKWTKSREIVFESKNALRYQKLMKKKWQKVKILKTGANLSGLASDICLIKDYYYHITFGNIIQWLEVYNPIFYQTQKTLFDFIRKNIS